jgi:hypothetical protein
LMRGVVIQFPLDRSIVQLPTLVEAFHATLVGLPLVPTRPCGRLAFLFVGPHKDVLTGTIFTELWALIGRSAWVWYHVTGSHCNWFSASL